MVNLLVWNAWGIIYAIISQLLTIMSANSLNSIFTSQSFGGAFQGASQMLLISLSSILLSIMILLIPFIAKRVVSGDIGSTMLTVAGVAAAAVQAAIAGWAGVQGGAASAMNEGGGGTRAERQAAQSGWLIDQPPPPPPAEGTRWCGHRFGASGAREPLAAVQMAPCPATAPEVAAEQLQLETSSNAGHGSLAGDRDTFGQLQHSPRSRLDGRNLGRFAHSGRWQKRIQVRRIGHRGGGLNMKQETDTATAGEDPDTRNITSTTAPCAHTRTE